MKKEEGKGYKLGIFVTIGFLLFLVAVYFLGKQKNIFGSTFTVKGIFTNVGGLQPGNNVRYSGINVGTVEDISFLTDTTVVVSMVIDNKVKGFLREDSRLIISSEGLMGDKIINVLPGSSKTKAISDNAYLKSIKPVEFDEILAKLKETSENAAVITGDLADIIDNIHEGRGTLGALIMDTTFATNVKQTIRSVKKGTEGFSQNMEAAKHSFLFRGFFKKKARQEKEKAEQQKK